MNYSFVNKSLHISYDKIGILPDKVVIYPRDGDTPIPYMPERTCKNLATRKDDFYCSECGCEVVGCIVDDFGSFDNPLCFSYCPNCGAKVVE